MHSLQNANTLAMDDNDDDDSDSSNKNVGYDYLLSMALWTLTKEKIEELEQQKQDDARKVRWMSRTFVHMLIQLHTYLLRCTLFWDGAACNVGGNLC